VSVSRGIDHLGLTVTDVERSLGFWRDLLGLEVTGRGVIEWEHIDRLTAIPHTKIEWVELTLPDGAVIELQQYHRPTAAPLAPGAENEAGRSHVSIVVGDLESLLRDARSAGFRTRSQDPVAIPRGAYTGSLAAYVLDPDGYSIELMEHPETRPRSATG